MALDVFRGDWNDQDVQRIAPYSEQHRAELQESFRARSEIYYKGGRGWRSPGDLSRIRWIKKVTPFTVS